MSAERKSPTPHGASGESSTQPVASRKSPTRHGASGKSASAAPPAAQAADTVSGGLFLGGGWQGAGYSSLRGYVYWPTMDPRREIDSFSRREIARRAHFLRANNGMARRMVNALTNLVVGKGLTPQAETEDQEWNQLAEDSFAERARQAATYDVAGRLTASQAQRLMVGAKYWDGDAAIVYSKSQSGGAMRSFYSGVQIGNPAGASSEDEGFVDGLKLDRLGRIQKFRVMNGGGTDYTDVDAAHVRWLASCDAPGQLRGMSKLAHAINKLVDITEISAAQVAGIKSSAQIGYYIATAANQQGGNNMTAQLVKEFQIAAGVDGKKVRSDRLFHTAPGGEVLELPVGRELKTLLDPRPHPNTMEFVEGYMIRDIAWGFGVSADLLWNISKLGGAGTRYVLADAQVFVDTEQQDLVDSWLAFDFNYHCATAMAAGQLRRCKDARWWRHSWVAPERITVDFGRDGAQIIKKWEKILISTNRIYSMAGQDARQEFSGEMDFVEWMKAEMDRRGISREDMQWYRGNAPKLAADGDRNAAADGEEKADADDEKVDTAGKGNEL